MAKPQEIRELHHFQLYVHVLIRAVFVIFRRRHYKLALRQVKYDDGGKIFIAFPVWTA